MVVTQFNCLHFFSFSHARFSRKFNRNWCWNYIVVNNKSTTIFHALYPLPIEMMSKNYVQNIAVKPLAPVVCGSTWVLNILTSFLRVQTMENCSSFVNSNTELSLPCLSYSWSQLYNKKPVYSNRQIPGFSCQLMVQSKCLGPGTPVKKKANIRVKSAKKSVNKVRIEMRGKGGTTSPPQFLGPFPCLNPSLTFALFSTINECSACLVVSQTHHLKS